MHIEPGIVDGSKIAISYVSAAALFCFTARTFLIDLLKKNIGRLTVGCLVTTLITFISFEFLPHPTVAVSEVHLILGSTLLLIFGFPATAFGMALGLLLQGVLFSPFDLPQYGMNVTTLLASLWVTATIAKSLISSGVRYCDITYKDALKLSVLFQGSIVTWVAFWVVLGQGFSMTTLTSLIAFGLAYVPVVAIEVIVSISLLYFLRTTKETRFQKIFNSRLFHPHVA